MSVGWRVVLLLVVGGIICAPFSLLGRLKQLTLPALTASDLKQSALSFADQRKRIMQYFYAVDRIFSPCGAATQTHDSNAVVSACRRSARLLAQQILPRGLPVDVSANLAFYHQAVINEAFLLAARWDNTRKDGGGFWPFLRYWTIDTCGANSVPHRLLRLYSLDWGQVRALGPGLEQDSGEFPGN